jgi:hypothetical protein
VVRVELPLPVFLVHRQHHLQALNEDLLETVLEVAIQEVQVQSIQETVAEEVVMLPLTVVHFRVEMEVQVSLLSATHLQDNTLQD